MEKLIKDKYYGHALIDNRKEKMGGYIIEPPTLFRGRGDHPRNGFLKARVYPEDITINVSHDAPVPKCEEPGRAWGSVVHKNDVKWLAFYKDHVINNSTKYIFLSSNSLHKGKSDLAKYEKARSLKNMIDKIRKDYMEKVEGKDKTDRQLGVITYLIDKLALRAGNEKNEAK